MNYETVDRSERPRLELRSAAVSAGITLIACSIVSGTFIYSLRFVTLTDSVYSYILGILQIFLPAVSIAAAFAIFVSALIWPILSRKWVVAIGLTAATIGYVSHKMLVMLAEASIIPHHNAYTAIAVGALISAALSSVLYYLLWRFTRRNIVGITT
ncbi:MAG: hypothetical protein IFK94_12540 [Acidobacteria bacterium]|uniref:Uncharacterized protein n=1 Tax=Candidatus Polarisedimenticola svalbardensis TaxID=2886004 RepID=A0A8J6Y1X6_9BACT|nr:hypothetical protein [Candidatus Polarisedimenticola svalbardensis]